MTTKAAAHTRNVFYTPTQEPQHVTTPNCSWVNFQVCIKYIAETCRPSAHLQPTETHESSAKVALKSQGSRVEVAAQSRQNRFAVGSSLLRRRLRLVLVPCFHAALEQTLPKKNMLTLDICNATLVTYKSRRSRVGVVQTSSTGLASGELAKFFYVSKTYRALHSLMVPSKLTKKTRSNRAVNACSTGSGAA